MSYITKVENPLEKRIVAMDEMQPGDIGVVISGGYEGQVVTKVGTYGIHVIVSLSDKQSFCNGRDKSNRVELFPPGTVVTLTVK